VERSWYLSLIATAACASGGTGTPDARPSDAADCAKQTYYADADGDGHGDPAAPVEACAPPAGTVTSKDDCDDANEERHPGREEICDGLDNDCNGATIEVCPTGCMAIRRPPPDHLLHAYLVCNGVATWASARATCASAMFKLVQIDDAAENAFVYNLAVGTFGNVDIHIGGTDSVVEGTWVWDGSVPFWQGLSGGMPIGNRYANWEPGEPNSSGTEDCAEMRSGGRWNDDDCGAAQRFICRR
jgi:hypothetical protein